MNRVLLILMFSALFSVQTFAQSRSVTGKIMDENGNPLVGASINAVGSKSNTLSKAEGNFTIGVPSSVKKLSISYVGYNNELVSIEGQSFVTVKLKAGGGILDNVVVTGYTVVKKSEYSGAASKVTSEKINFVPMASLDQILQGRAPGLLVASGSGQPGAAARVQIRGQSSISGASDPLYVLDGMIIEAADFQALNANDFESVDVLKDATATALYGNRGSGGVIAITTKKGKTGKPVLSYNTQYGMTKVGAQKFEMMNSRDLLQFQENLGKFGVGTSLPGWLYSPINPAVIALSPAGQAQAARSLDSLRGINTDWSKVFQRQGKFSSHDINLSGGSGGTRFALSGGYYSEQGIALRSDLNRYTFRGNIENRSDKLSLSLSTGVGYTESSVIESENAVALANPFAAAYLALPYHAIYNPDGSIAVGNGKVGPNALDRIDNTTNDRGKLKATANLSATYNLVKNIYVGGSIGIDYRQDVDTRTIKPNSFIANTAAFPVGPATAGGIGGGSYRNTIGRFFEYIVRANAGYRNTFKGVHDVDVQLISEYTRDQANGFSYTGYGINPKLLGSPAGITPGSVQNRLVPAIGGSIAQRALYAAIMIGKYTYAGKYTFNVSIRRDASSQLSPVARWNNFYSLGGTWNVLKENFASKWNVLSELRMRASFGSSANADNISTGYYGYFTTYGGSNTYNGQPVLTPSAFGFPELTWEKVEQMNLGIDFGFLKNRIKGTFDIYNKKTKQNIVDQILPLTGYSQGINAATIRNKGVELSLSGDVIKTASFTWTLGGNISYNNNRVLDLGQVREFEQGTELIKVGLPLGSHYIVKWGGVDAATGAPLYWTRQREEVDASGKTIIIPSRLTNLYSDADQVSDFGTYNAPWIGGFNTGFNYKGIQLDAFFTFQKGFSRFNNQDFFQQNHAFAVQGFNLKREMLAMWQNPGDVTNIQSPLYQRQFSSKDIQDASFLRFRNVSLSYTLPSSLWKRQNYISNIRISGQVQNILTWTNWTGFDPEDNNNIAQYEYPAPRTYILGLNITFK